MRRGIVLGMALLGLLVAASTASANFHLIKIREIRAQGTGVVPFVELQMYSSGQTQLAGHPLTTYQSNGTLIDTVPLSNVANGQNQRTVLIAPGAVDGANPDITASLGFTSPGGAVCFDSIDCVSYGSFSGSLPSPAGTPVAGYPAADGSRSITRSIAAGCATLLESGDDTNDSAADFAIGAPSPRNNAAAPSEAECGPDGGGDADEKAPRTEITDGPKKRSEKTKAKFKFNSSEQGSTFKCKLDQGKFKDCDSPRKYTGLDPGKHKFQVRATDKAGNTDQTPAKLRFRVLES